MKHSFAVVAAVGVLASPAIVSAQDLSGGVRAGVNLSDVSISGSSTPLSENLTGFAAGAFLIVPANATVAFQPELLYSSQGTKFVEGSQSAKFRIDYVQVPLLGRFSVGRGGPLAFLLGPSLGIKTHAEVKGPGSSAEFSKAFEDSLERFDVGFVAGASVDVARLVLDGRYTWGLKNISKDSGPESARNRVISFTAGVRF